MKFADPKFLFALALVLIPILIHFLQFKRYKTVYFSQVNFLKLLLNESKKKNNLKQLLILLSRVFAIIFLVLAFAEPYLPLHPETRISAQTIVGIYIDNSFSMNSKAEKSTLLEDAKQKAIELVNSFPPGTNFLLLTNEAESKHQLSLSREQLISEIGGVGTCATSLQTSQVVAVLNRQMDALFPKAAKSIYILSDFQSYQADFDKIKATSSASIFLLPFRAIELNDICLDSVWFENPGRLKSQTESLKIRITNKSGQSYHTVPVKLFINDSLKAMQPVNLKAGETIETELSYQNLNEGFHHGKVELDDYPMVFDNSFYFSYRVEKEVRTLAIYQQNDEAFNWLSKLYQNDLQIKLDGMDASRIQLNGISNYQCIFLLNLDEIPGSLKSALIRFVQNGGSLVVFPGQHVNLNDYQQLFSELNGLRLGEIAATEKKMEKLNLKNKLYSDVFNYTNKLLNLPVIRQSYQLTATSQNLATDLISNNDGTIALCEVQAEKGRLYQFSFPLTRDASDFFRHALFVPTLYNLALQSYTPQTIQYTLQPNAVILVRENNESINNEKLSLKSRESEQQFQFAPSRPNAGQIRLNLGNIVQNAGFYDLYSEANIIRALAFNYDRKEADNSFLSDEQLSKIASESKQQISVFQTNQANWLSTIEKARDLIELWKYCILLALCFAVTELLIIRYWK